MQAVKQIFYVKVWDDRMAPSSHLIWQSETYNDKAKATKTGRRLAQEFRRSDISSLTKGWYINPSWNKSGAGVKHHLHVELVTATFYNDKTHSAVEETIK